MHKRTYLALLDAWIEFYGWLTAVSQDMNQVELISEAKF